MAHRPSVPAPASEIASDDLNDYDVISDTDPYPRSLDSSLADLRLDSPSVAPSNTLSLSSKPSKEPRPHEDARSLFAETVELSAEDVQAYVQSQIQRGVGVSGKDTGTVKGRKNTEKEKLVRIYVDGVFDVLSVGTMLQLRQAKLSFPSVHLLVGPFTDVQTRAHAVPCSIPYAERCELLRHVRWIDEVLFDAPVVLSEDFLSRHRIDYVAIEEGSSVNPGVSKARLAGYDLVKSIGKAITTRRTRNVVASTLVLVSPEVSREAEIQSKSTSTTPAMPPSRKLGADDFMPPMPPPPSTGATYNYTDDAEHSETPWKAIQDATPPEPKEEFGA